jgi:hypothetical protein
MNMKHIALNGGIYFHVTPEEQIALRPLMRPIFRNGTGVCHSCACCCNDNDIIFNATISEMQCLDCFEDWSRGYNLSKEDYKRQAYNAESAERILNKD